MTYVSAWIEATLDIGPEKKRLKLDLPSATFGDRLGPYCVRDWADRELLEIEYIDNCWVKVPAPRAKVVDFLHEFYGDKLPPSVHAAISALGLEWQMVLVAEEF